jgi:hypothetical protein
MSQQTYQHRFVSGHRRLLVITIALGIVNAVAAGLVLDSQAAAARECARETPLPADVRLIAPTPEVPEAVPRARCGRSPTITACLGPPFPLC